MRLLITILFLSLTLFCQPVFALSLQEAKAQGLVGEMTSGYLAPVKDSSQAVKELVADINTKRKTHYQGIAQKNGTSLQAVEQLAGKAAIKKTPSGYFVNDGTGWKRK